MLAGYSTPVVTMRSPNCQSSPLATMLIPSLVFLTKAISSRWALMIDAASTRSFSMSLYQLVNRYALLSDSAECFRIASAATRGIGETPAWLKKSHSRRIGNSSTLPTKFEMSRARSSMRDSKYYNPAMMSRLFCAVVMVGLFAVGARAIDFKKETAPRQWIEHFV